MSGDNMTDDIERIDEDPDAETDDSRIRICAGEHGTYEIIRERYTLVEAPGPSDDIERKRYDWLREQSFVLRSEAEARQVAAMLSKEGAFDPNVLFFGEWGE